MDEWMDESWMDGRMTVWMGRWKGTGGSGGGKEWGGKEWNRGKGGGGEAMARGGACTEVEWGRMSP